MFDDVVEETQPEIAFPFGKGHLEWVGGEGSGEDMRGGEDFPDVLAAGMGGHHRDDDFTADRFDTEVFLFETADVWAGGGVSHERAS